MNPLGFASDSHHHCCPSAAAQTMEAEAEGSTSAHNDAQSILLAAGRLEAQLAVRPDAVTGNSSDILACSVDNLLAIVDSPSAIKLVHLSAPHRVHTLAIQEKPYLLTFSPRGDALFAAFQTGRMCCLWTRASQALNEWRVRQAWTDWQGRVLDLQWLAAPRKWTSKGFTRRPAAGPQFAAERATSEVGAVAVCEGGQVRLFYGNIAGDDGMQVQMASIAISPQEKIAKAAIGLVPDESTVLVAFTKRMSSKATLPLSTAEGDALGMFFGGAQGVASLNQQKSSISQLDDGQDKIEMIEVRIDLATTLSSLVVRALLPTYLSSYETRSMPSSTSLTNLVWLEGSVRVEAETTSTKMKLFAAFYHDSTTTLRTWEAQREEVEALSEAFAKLESAKSRTDDDEREDWVIKTGLHESYTDHVGSHFQVVPSGEALLCSWTYSPPADSLFKVKKPRTSYQLIDCTSLQLIDEKLVPALQSPSCTPAISANGFLLAQIVNGKVCIVEASKHVRWCSEEVYACWPALNDARDVSDVLRILPCDLDAIASAINIDGSFELSSRMIRLAAQRRRQREHIVLAKNSRLLLELIQCFDILRKADKEVYWEPSQIWVVVSVLEWIIWVIEAMAKQAYLMQASVTVLTPAPTEDLESAAATDGDADLLALMTSALPRKVVIGCIVRIIKFCNWLNRVNRSKTDVKAMMSSADFQNTLKASTQAEESKLWGISDTLRLAHMQVGEAMLNSAIDLGQTGRVLKAYSDDKEEVPSKRRWWASLDTGNRTKMATFLIEGNSIKDALSLFCSANGDAEDGRATERDVMTKARLNVKAIHFVCLSCTAKTQLSLQFGQRCICGSQSWWKVS